MHDSDAIAEVSYDRHVVTDEHVREVPALLQVQKKIENLRLDRHVEGGNRFVHYQHVWIENERTRNSHSLELASRKSLRIAVVVLLLEADLGKARENAPPALGGRNTPDTEGLGGIVAYAEVGIERAERS